MPSLRHLFLLTAAKTSNGAKQKPAAYAKKKGSKGWSYGLSAPDSAFLYVLSHALFYERRRQRVKGFGVSATDIPHAGKTPAKRIAEILDKMDYEGSMLYDEYPDKWQLYRLKESIVEILKNEEDEKEAGSTSPEKWEWMGDMVQLVLYYEIYKRRHGRHSGFLKF